MSEKMKECPRCGQMTLHPVRVRNALSRRDNKTAVCDRCGVEEAFEDAFGKGEHKIWNKEKEYQEGSL